MEMTRVWYLSMLVFSLCIGLSMQCKAQESTQKTSDEDNNKLLDDLSKKQIRSLKYIYGPRRPEEAFGAYTEVDLRHSHCVYVTERPALIADIANALKQSVVAFNTPSFDEHWEPREELTIGFKDDTKADILFDHDPFHEPISGSINGTPFTMNTKLIKALHQWALAQHGNKRCLLHLSNETWK